MSPRHAFAMVLCALGTFLAQAGEPGAWASQSVQKKKTGVWTPLGRELIRKTYQAVKKANPERVIKVKATATGVKFYEEGFPDNRNFARITECGYRCVVVHEHEELRVYVPTFSEATEERWKIDQRLGDLLMVTKRGEERGRRRLMLESDPSKWSPWFDRFVQQIGTSFVVQDEENFRLISAADPSRESLPFRKVVAERGPNLLVDNGGKQQFLVSTADPRNSSSLFDRVVRDLGATVLVEYKEGNYYLVLKSDPTNESRIFAKGPTDEGPNWRIQRGMKQHLVSKQNPSYEVETTKHVTLEAPVTQ